MNPVHNIVGFGVIERACPRDDQFGNPMKGGGFVNTVTACVEPMYVHTYIKDTGCSPLLSPTAPHNGIRNEEVSGTRSGVLPLLFSKILRMF
jgi:hypothetical protein